MLFFRLRNLNKIKVISILLSSSFLILNLLSCSRQTEKSTKEVYIKESSGKYSLYRNGQPYIIKGAAGYSHFNTLKNIGGNTIRIWDTVGLSTILDSARLNKLAVIVGLPIANSDYMALYNDSTKVTKQHNAFKAIVNRFKGHPAVLMWCIGNELDFPYKPSYNNFYQAFNKLTDMIRKEDPNHPITTTVLNFNKKYISNIKFRCNIDIISFNIFNRINYLRDDIKSATLLWRGPYMIAEWGIDGPWDGTLQTAWGAYVENTSNKKAEFYLNRYKKYMPLEDPRFLGCFIFYWGNKQEGTHTWFSIFDENGASSEAVDVMRHIWTGKRQGSTFPQIKYMLLNKKGAMDNIILSSHANANAEVLLLEQSKIKAIKWEVFKEDWYKENLHNIKKLKPLQNLIKSDGALKVDFIAPKEEGPYRLFATIYDYNGHFATCNTPFYVVADK
ncbi:MAG: glycoside hydrolase family 2 TIM barrel-domain containing protein [Pedobacter sp.]|uniref:glycoside hydrolase family 2 TIM barrel-domain containing protein n=1 Tax=Pedobacter sp. TaxID=1411316 RepID=UPI0035683EF0